MTSNFARRSSNLSKRSCIRAFKCLQSADWVPISLYGYLIPLLGFQIPLEVFRLLQKNFKNPPEGFSNFSKEISKNFRRIQIPPKGFKIPQKILISSKRISNSCREISDSTTYQEVSNILFLKRLHKLFAVWFLPWDLNNFHRWESECQL